MRLRTILFILSLLAFFSAITGSGLYYSALSQSALKETRIRGESIAKETRHLISFFLTNEIKAVRALARHPELAQALTKADSITLKKVNSILDLFHDSLAADVVYLMDRQGRTIASSNRNDPFSFVGKHYFFRPYFQQAIRGKPAVYMALGTTSTKRGIYYGHPVFQAGNPAGVVVVKAAVAPLENRFFKPKDDAAKMMMTGPHGVVFMSDQKDLLFRVLWEIPDKARISISDSKQFGKGPWEWAGFKQMGKDRVIDASGNDYLIFQSQIDFFPGWNIVHLYDLKGISKRIAIPFSSTFGYTIAALCLLIGLAVLCLYKMGNTDLIKRQEAETALLTSVSLLDATLNATADGILVVGREGEIRAYNKQFIALWRLPETVLATRDDNRALAFVQDQLKDPRGFLEKIQELYDHPKEESFDILKLKDGRILERFSKPQKVDNAIVGRVWSFRNVTERYKTETELQKMFQAVEQSPSAVVVTDTRGTIQYVNPKFCELTGFGTDEAIGQNPRILNSGVHPAAFYRDMWTTIASGRTWRGELCNRKKNGSLYWESVSIASVKDASGKISHYVAVEEDITLRKQIQEEMKKAKEYAELLNKLTPSAIFTVDLEKRITSWNDQATKITGYTAEELIGQKCTWFALTPCTEKCGLLSEDVIKPVFDRECTIRRKDGQVRTIKKNLEVLTDHTGDMIGGIECFEDITEAKKAAQELKAAKENAEMASQSKSRFLANMSHEIRTPLNSVLGFLDLVLGDPRLDARHRSHLATAQGSANTLLRVINDILDISKLERGKLTIEVRPFRISRLMRDIESIMRIKADEKGLDLTLKLHPSLAGTYAGDPLRLKQILMNLVSNAIKFTDHGRVVMGAEPAGEEGRIHFMVEDTGIGIPADRLPQIFEPFTQADASTTRQYGGTGLGTTIARELVELMGGRIWADSETGKGSTFHFDISLPPSGQTPDDGDGTVDPGQDQGQGLDRPLRILLVEDVQINVDLALIRLEQKGHKVVVAWNGIEAVAAFEQGDFDVVLMDIQMPEMGGVEATERIRRIESSTKGHVPIIAMTAAVMPEEKEVYIQKGMDAVVAKPIDYAKLFQEIQAVVPAEDQAKHPEQPPLGFDPGLPRLKGIDMKRGLDVWQHPQTYINELRAFSREHRHTANQLKALVKQGDLDHAFQVAHKIKGVAGNLALTNLTAAIIPFEKALKNRQMNAMAPLVSNISQALNEVSLSIGRLKAADQTADPGNKQMDTARLKRVFAEMTAAFDQYSPSAIEPFLSELAAYISRDQLDPIAQHMERFDFDAAKQETVKLSKRFQADSENNGGEQ